MTLTPCARSGSRPKRAAATRDSPCGGRAAVPDPGSRWARAAEGGRDGSRPCPIAAGSGEPWRARPAPRRAQARSQGWRAATLGFRSLSVLRELRATGAVNPRSTRTHAPHAYVKPRPGVRTSTCPLGGRPRPRVGRGGARKVPEAGWRRDQREKRSAVVGGTKGGAGPDWGVTD